jgi:hypothetical protein
MNTYEEKGNGRPRRIWNEGIWTRQRLLGQLTYVYVYIEEEMRMHEGDEKYVNVSVGKPGRKGSFRDLVIDGVIILSRVGFRD